MSVQLIIQERTKAQYDEVDADWYDDPEVQPVSVPSDRSQEDSAILSIKRSLAAHGDQNHLAYFEHRIIMRTEIEIK